MDLRSTRNTAKAVVAVLAMASMVLVGSASPASAVGGTPIDSAGPLTRILVGTDTQCQVFYTGDTAGEFYGSDDSGACGTFVALAGVLYGPATVPAGGSATPRTAFTPVSQTPVSGDGSAATPYTVTTVADLGATGFQITETNTYVVGQEFYLTSVSLANTTGNGQSAVIYRAGDCYLQDSDNGFGRVDGNAVSCVSPESGRIQQWFPITPGSTLMEGTYSSVWAAIGSQQPFDNSCLCDQTPGMEHDNGAGLSWVRTIEAGQTVTVSHYTTFSPLGFQAPTVTKTADIGQVDINAADGYTITVTNPGEFSITLDGITDDLPAGFTYTAGSTTGATTTDPTVTGQQLEWGGPFTVAAQGTISLHFGVTVSGIPGTYTNTANASGPGLAVVGAVDVAPVVVIDPVPVTEPPAPPPAVRPVAATPRFTG